MSKWTYEQKQAIYARSCNVLVSAGAGSGKTAVLVERVISLITDAHKPLDIDKILVVTFTKAAAEEMRMRLHDRLNELLLEQPHNYYLQRQLALLPSASVTTLHSFCLEILKHHFSYIGLEGGFRIGKDYELYLLRKETLEEYIEQQYAENGRLLTALADAYGGSRDDSGLLALAERIYDFCVSQPQPLEWLEAQCKQVENARSLRDIPSCAWYLSLLQQRCVQAERLLMQALEQAEADAGDKAITVLRAEAEMASKLSEAFDKSFAEINSLLAGMKFGTLSIAKACEPCTAEGIKQLRNTAKDILKELAEKFVYEDEQGVLEELYALNPLIKGLCALVKGFYLAYRTAKQERGLIDFSDMEHYCLEILQKARREGNADIFEMYDEVLVDEYQDINNVQESIISIMSAKGNCFMVGDIKQAIYQFRLADTGLFLSKQQLFKQNIGGLPLSLNHNFRSLNTVIDAVNLLFSKLMTKELCSIDYKDGAALCCGREGEGEAAELYLLDGGDLASEEEGLPQREGKFIAHRIKQLLKAGARLEDIVILLRSPKSSGEGFAETLNECGVPAVFDSSRSCLEAPEIRQMLSLLRVLDNPLQDIELAAVMRGPFGNFTSDELLMLRMQYPEGYLYYALMAEAQTDNAKAAELYAKISLWSEQAAAEPISQLIRSIYNESGFYHNVGALTLGNSRQANLDALYEKALEFESVQAQGLFRFVQFLNDLQEQGKDFGAAKGLTEGEQAVRIISIHGSKGLQFPIVFVAGLGKSFNLQDRKQDVLIHKSFGICSKVIDRRRRIKYPTMMWRAISERLETETVAEELRVLYVALTRAQDKLILVGSSNNAESFINSIKNDGYEGEIPYIFSSNDMSYLKWICRAIYPHQAAEALRKLAGDNRAFPSMPGQWHIELVREQKQDTADEVKGITAAEPCPSETARYISELLHWQYAHKEACGTPVKWTVTELQKMAYEKDYSHYSRGLFEESELAASDLGTAYHLVMEKMDMSCPKSVPALIEALCRSGELSAEAAERLDLTIFYRFAESELAAQIIASGHVEKEKAFTVGIPADMLLPDCSFKDMLILQGKIDLYFWDEASQGYIIVDYKSGNRNATMESLQQHYGKQMSLYEYALNAITGKRVSAVYIYLLNEGCIYKMI